MTTTPERPSRVDRPPVEPFFSTFRADMDRFGVYLPNDSFLARARLSVVLPGVWATCAYRFARMLKTRRLPVIGPVLWLVYLAWELLVRCAGLIRLDPDARIGPGLHVSHFGAIHVGPGVVIGRYASFGQTTYIGASGPEARGGAPVIGERVYIGVGAKILGGVKIGDGAAIGAGAVVLEDVPENAVVVGVPARVVNYNGSADFIKVTREEAGSNPDS